MTVGADELVNLKNENGSSLIESIVVMPILIILTAGVSVSLLWGWARFEISQNLQELMVCERSLFGVGSCRRILQERLEKLPGSWRVLRFVRGPAEISVRMEASWSGRNYEFEIREPDPWRQARNK